MLVVVIGCVGDCGGDAPHWRRPSACILEEGIETDAAPASAGESQSVSLKNFF